MASDVQGKQRRCLEDVMKCESCGQEKPTVVAGDVVEITADGFDGLAVVAEIIEKGSNGEVKILPFTGRNKGKFVYCLAYELKVVHGYVHINRDGSILDYTRHAM